MAFQVDYSPWIRAAESRSQALSGLAGAIGGHFRDKQAASQAEQEKAQLNDLAERAMSGDTAAQDELAYTAPEINKEVMARIGAKTEQQQKGIIYDAAQALSLDKAGDKEGVINYLDSRIKNIAARGGDPSDTKRARDIYAADPEKGAKYLASSLMSMINPKEFASAVSGQGVKSQEVAAIQEFDYLTQGLSPEDRQAAKRIKLGLDPRATEAAESKAEKAFVTETAKLQAQYNLEPKVAGAVAAAKNEAKVAADTGVKNKSNDTAWNVYNSSMSNLSKAMEGTATGPVVGYIPAVTANSQIAEGAVAVMAPVLKQMFRTAGEGTFTDKDQELLMGMVPTRKDLPEARDAKIKAIDSVIRAKLGKVEETQVANQTQTGGQSAPKTVTVKNPTTGQMETWDLATEKRIK